MVAGERRPAVFLDRDGTIIEDRGNLRHLSEVVLIPGALDALAWLRTKYALFLVTNQPGVATGEIAAADVERVNAHLVGLLAAAGVEIVAVYYCPHAEDAGCDCRKPKTYFLEQAAAEHGLDLARSFVIGDHASDVLLAHNAGATGIFVLTGHGAKHRHVLPPGTHVADDIVAAAEWILARS